MPTYKELTAEIEKLQAQAEKARQKEVAGVVAQIHELVKQYELTPADIGINVGRRSRTKSPAAPKYRDPATGATWTGRGRVPAWIGKDRAKFEI